jgi:hypothetical protein
MFREQSQIGLKGRQRLHCVGRSSSGSAKPSDPPFLFRDDLLCLPYATLGQCERIVVHHDATARHGRRTLALRRLAVSPWTCGRLLEALNLNHRQIVETALIRAEAIGRTEPHPEIAMKDQTERFPTLVTSHGFNMRQTSFLALHLRSPFPRLRKTNAKTCGGFLTTPASGPLGPCRASRLSVRRHGTISDRLN